MFLLARVASKPARPDHGPRADRESRSFLRAVVIGAGVLALVAARQCEASTDHEPAGGRLDDLALALSFAAYAVLGVAVLAAARIHGGTDWRDLVAWRPFRLSRRIWLLAAATLAYSFVADAALGYFYPPAEGWFVAPQDAARAAALLVLAVAFAPVVEELIFRGYFYTVLHRRFGFWAALLVTSAAFAYLHYESTHLYALVVLPVGLLLGVIRETTGSVKPVIALHAFNNFLAVGSALLDLG